MNTITFTRQSFYQVPAGEADPFYRSSTYASRHFRMASLAQTTQIASLAHRIIGVFELCPFLGSLVGLIDKYIFAPILFDVEHAEARALASTDQTFAFPVTPRSPKGTTPVAPMPAAAAVVAPAIEPEICRLVNRQMRDNSAAVEAAVDVDAAIDVAAGLLNLVVPDSGTPRPGADASLSEIYEYRANHFLRFLDLIETEAAARRREVDEALRADRTGSIDERQFNLIRDRNELSRGNLQVIDAIVIRFLVDMPHVRGACTAEQRELYNRIIRPVLERASVVLNLVRTL